MLYLNYDEFFSFRDADLFFMLLYDLILNYFNDIIK